MEDCAQEILPTENNEYEVDGSTSSLQQPYFYKVNNPKMFDKMIQKGGIKFQCVKNLNDLSVQGKYDFTQDAKLFTVAFEQCR